MSQNMTPVKTSMQQIKAQIHARLILEGMNFNTWAISKNYNPNLVYVALGRLKKNKPFIKGSKSEQIISELLEMIGEKPRTIN